MHRSLSAGHRRVTTYIGSFVYCFPALPDRSYLTPPPVAGRLLLETKDLPCAFGPEIASLSGAWAGARAAVPPALECAERGRA